MGTPCAIIVERTDGTWAGILCNYDGFLEDAGRKLFDHYNSQSLAEALVAPGDLSFLEASCEKPEGHSYDHPVKGHSVYYGRDRGEDGTEAAVGDFTEVCKLCRPGTAYTYVWHQGKGWYYGKTLTKTLAEALDCVPKRIG